MKKAIIILFYQFISLSIGAQIILKHLPRVDSMSDLPQPFKIIDFKKLALDFDKKVYDFNTQGKYWPLIWIDSSHKNFPQQTIGIYTAIGDYRQGPLNNKGMFHEALANIGSVLGASLSGINKTRQNGINYVAALKNYFNSDNGWNIMMNNTCSEVALAGGGYGRDWWYDVYPNVLFYALYYCYPNEKGFDIIAKKIAEKFYAADSILDGNYDFTYFDFSKMRPAKSDICIQPDAAAGMALVLYDAYKKFGDKRYLNASIRALKSLENHKENYFYEIFMPYAAYLAARLNSEENQNFNIDKFLKWTFDGDAKCRTGWGVLLGNWNGFDISGTIGSNVDRGGYGFLMNTYDAAMPLIPMVRYNQAYAAVIGKWMLNAANAAKLFYPQYMPENHQTLYNKSDVTKGVIAYEGIIKHSDYSKAKNMEGPIAQGDGPLWNVNNPDVSQFSVYGSGHVGVFGSIIQPTNIDGILQLDLLATDFYRSKSFHTYLYYNPYSKAKTIYINVPEKQTFNLYNLISQKFVARNISKSTKLIVNPKDATVIVFVPSNGKISYAKNKLLINNIVVDYRYIKGKF